MCGIIGACSTRNVLPDLIEGLARLEYRGYDSCGLSWQSGGAALKRLRSTERVAQLANAAQGESSPCGIAHTRWATHGAPVTLNAHPHASAGPGIGDAAALEAKAQIALVHNGIIENYVQLRENLRAQGYVFLTQTDSEVAAHLLDHLYRGDLLAAMQQMVSQLRGSFALAAIAQAEPGCIVGARQGSPLVLGLGRGEYFLASDALAFAGVAERVIYLQEGDVVALSADGYDIRAEGAPEQSARREAQKLSAQLGAVELAPYRHYMQKEIFEQPRALADTVADIESADPALFGDQAAQPLAQCRRVLILACGTSYYAGLVGRQWIETLAHLPVSVEIASEYRSRESVYDADTLVVTISQSGETADTLAALRHAKSQGLVQTLTLCNSAGSALTRESQNQFITRAGIEVGVASTKAFTTQLAALFLLALTLARSHARLSAPAQDEHLRALRHLPAALGAVLAQEPGIIAWAERFARKEHALFLGRGLHYPIALEGALKLKEVSYIHAEAYPAGELKHGPLALVTEAMPVVTVAPNDALLEKLRSNMQEVKARGGELYILADADTHLPSDCHDHVIRLPEHYGLLSPLLHVVPLQLLAYHTALLRGSDVDKPRNLAKSVTVE